MPLEVLPKFIQNIAVWLPGFNFGNGAWQIIRGNAPEFRNILLLLGYFFLFTLLSGYIRKNQEATA